MQPLIVVAITFLLLWVLFIRPQQRRVRGHQALVASLEPGDHVVLTAGIYGRIVDMGPEDMTIEVAPGVELRVARQAVLRRTEDVTVPGPDDRTSQPHDLDAETGDTVGPHAADDVGATLDLDETPEAPAPPPDTGAAADPAPPDPDDRGPAGPGSPMTS